VICMEVVGEHWWMCKTCSACMCTSCWRKLLNRRHSEVECKCPVCRSAVVI
jgi:hypothetical protein